MQIEVSLAPEASITETLTVHNNGAAELLWTVVGHEWLPTCGYPMNPPWLTMIAPLRANTAPASSTDVTIGLDAAGLVEGTYSTDICVVSNSHSEAVMRVPLSLTVGAPTDDRGNETDDGASAQDERIYLPTIRH
jgi:hypothetical protein